MPRLTRSCGTWTADPQLRYLDKCGYVDYVLTVDSDLIALGARRTLIMKDYGSGAARLYTHDAIFNPVVDHDPEEEPLLAAFQRGGPTAMLDYAMGAGCDYCKFTNVAGSKLCWQLLRRFAAAASAGTPRSPQYR